MGKITQATEKQIISDTIAAILTCGSKRKAAAALEINEATLYDRINNYPQINEAISKAKAIATQKLIDASPKAADIMVSGMDDRKQMYDSAKYILDGIGVTNNRATGLKIETKDMKVEFLDFEN